MSTNNKNKNNNISMYHLHYKHKIVIYRNLEGFLAACLHNL